MNLRDLEYLVAVADHRHFRKAAEACFVSQPTLSGQLKKLEESLGVQLFERNNRSVLITPLGEEIAERARAILESAADLKDYARVRAQPMSGVVRTGLIFTLAPYLLPHIMQPIRAAYPDLKLQLIENQTHVLVEMLREGKLDLAILALPIEEDGLEECPLFDEPFFLAVNPDHPLADRSVVSSVDLDDQSVMLLEEGHCLGDQALAFCRTAGAQASDSFRATSLETLRHMVAGSQDVTLVPKLAVPKQNNGPLVYIPFTKPSPARTIGFLYRKNTSRLPTFDELGIFIKDLMIEAID